jgi:hypothetical protein
MSVDELARRLRTGPISVIGRIKQDRLLLDLRSVFASQDSLLADAFGRFSVDSSAPKES